MTSPAEANPLAIVGAEESGEGLTAEPPQNAGAAASSESRQDKQIATLAEKLERATQKRDHYRDEVLGLRASREQYRQQMLEMRKSRSEYREQVLELRKSRESYRQQVLELRKSRENYRQQVIELRGARRDLAEEVKVLRAGAVRSGFAEALARGVGIGPAAVQFTEALVAARDRLFARAFAHALLDAPETADIGRICTAIQAIGDEFDDYAAELFAATDPRTAMALAPAHVLGLGLRRDADEGERQIRRIMADGPELGSAMWWGVAQQAGGLQLYPLLADLLSHIRRIDPALDGLGESEITAFRWTEERLAKMGARRPIATPAAGEIALGIIDYKALDRNRASSNVGDYVQTLAFLSNLLRFQDVEYGDSPLGQKLEAMKEKVLPERRLSGLKAKVVPIPVDRDNTSGTVYPTPTWTVAFGWYMHANFDEHFDFPFTDSIRPIFISFHVNNRDMLTDEAAAYLRRYGPIGCRDWTTVYLLRERGVEAFFSGCMTTTIGQIFTAPPPEARAGTIALVDYTPTPGEFPDREAVKFTQVGDDVRELDMVSGLDEAEALLQGYRAYGTIATSRLHCYLPCTSIGLDVIFRPRRRSDVRFEGLLDLDGPTFNRIRTGIETKVERVLKLILSGRSEEEVYAGWRALCADDLAEAERYCTNIPPLPEPSFDVGEMVKRMTDHLRIYNGPVNVAGTVNIAFALDANLEDQLPVVIESALERLSRPATINILARGLDDAYFAKLAASFPSTCFRVFSCDDVDYGADLRLLKHTTVSTIDRLLLPEQLTDTNRLIYLDIDIFVAADLAELWDMDLQGHPLGGKQSNYPSWRYGHNMVYRAAANLEAERAWELRRRMHAAGSLDFPAFNAGVLLMDLERMRADDFSRHAIPLVERYAMNDQDALNVYARFDRIELGRAWNAVPSQDPTGDAKIIHYAGPIKPWESYHTLRRDDFEAARDRFNRRLDPADKG